ncbi:MAG: hypothetical protein L0I17_07955 [Actinomycetia bacterium]|nr:hypothetical protein [Actinomycetes bacterium]
MTRLIEDLKAAGWVETTLGECRPGEEVLLIQAGRIPRALTVTRVHRETCVGETSDGTTRANKVPVLRAPRSECAPGTVAMIRWSEDKPPVRAWKIPGCWILPSSAPLDDDSVEVIRVLLPADQDIPPIEVTDEMVERAAEACYRARCYKEITTGSRWDEMCEDTPINAARYRQEARAALEAALEVEK